MTATTERVPDSGALVATGSVTPAKPGVSATLWRVAKGSRRWWARPRSPTTATTASRSPMRPGRSAGTSSRSRPSTATSPGRPPLQTVAGPPLSTLDDASARLNAERDVIATRLAGLRGDFAGVVQASRDSNADDEHDVEGDDRLRAFQVDSLIRQVEGHLAQIDEALERVAAGTYGVCVACGSRSRPVA